MMPHMKAVLVSFFSNPTLQVFANALTRSVMRMQTLKPNAKRRTPKYTLTQACSTGPEDPKSKTSSFHSTSRALNQGTEDL